MRYFIVHLHACWIQLKTRNPAIEKSAS